MLEKIPVGGWRHAERRDVEVFAGRAKARDVVPNWPRGRTTSALYWTTLQRLKVMYENYHGHHQLHLSHDRRWAEDEAMELAEERRKAAMMEAWYHDQMVIADSGLSWERHREHIIRAIEKAFKRSGQ